MHRRIIEKWAIGNERESRNPHAPKDVPWSSSTGETVVVIEQRIAHAHPICARLVGGFHRESEVSIGLNEVAPVEQSWDF